MAHVDVARHEHGLNRVREVEQTQQVAGGTARAAYGLCCELMRETKLFDEALQALRFFERVEVFALDVFNQRHRGSGFVGHVAHEHGHGVEAC